MTERKTPVRLRSSGLTGNVYAITRYTIRGDLLIAQTKHDVTQDFYDVAAELWPHLVTDGHLTPRKPTPDPAPRSETA